MFDFSKALELLKKGFLLTREGWGAVIAYQPGYPDGIPCNENTAKAWNLEEGTLFRCQPYLQKREGDRFYMWSPTTEDLLAEDWVIVH